MRTPESNCRARVVLLILVVLIVVVLAGLSDYVEDRVVTAKTYQLSAPLIAPPGDSESPGESNDLLPVNTLDPY